MQQKQAEEIFFTSNVSYGDVKSGSDRHNSPVMQHKKAEEIFFTSNVSYGDVTSGSDRHSRKVDSPQDAYDYV